MSSAPIAAAITAITSVDTPAAVVLLLRICARSTADNNDGVGCGRAARGVVPVTANASLVHLVSQGRRGVSRRSGGGAGGALRINERAP